MPLVEWHTRRELDVRVAELQVRVRDAPGPCVWERGAARLGAGVLRLTACALGRTDAQHKQADRSRGSRHATAAGEHYSRSVNTAPPSHPTSPVF